MNEMVKPRYVIADIAAHIHILLKWYSIASEHINMTGVVEYAVRPINIFGILGILHKQYNKGYKA